MVQHKNLGQAGMIPMFTALRASQSIDESQETLKDLFSFQLRDKFQGEFIQQSITTKTRLNCTAERGFTSLLSWQNPNKGRHKYGVPANERSGGS